MKIKKANSMTYPEVLLISTLYDFSTDFIAIELDSRSVNYLRINRDELKNYSIVFDPVEPSIVGQFNGNSFVISHRHLKSIYYRAPTFLRDIFQEGLTEEEQLIRTQWAAFVRSLCVFEDVQWFNNPIHIYKAEIKPYQIYLAHKLGMKIPATLVSNSTRDITHEHIAIKSIDTAIVSSGDHEGFVYTELYERSHLVPEQFTSPFFVQQGLLPKIDIRVTVIRDVVIAVKITSDKLINEDWRRYKNELKYTVIELPNEIREFCVKYVNALDLNFGAIDLIFHNGAYYFIEINPTGEWSWLQQNTGFRFDSLIVEALKNA